MAVFRSLLEGPAKRPHKERGVQREKSSLDL